MAQAVYTQTSDLGLGRFGALVQTVKVAMQRRAIFKQTVAELNALSARELGDLGLSRSNIRSVAFEAAYGK